MFTFIIGLLILIVGSALYGRLCDIIFKPDDRQTPAYAKGDGVDYVPMSIWKNTLINLLNIAGTGPILGPIQGILFGPLAFITIPIGNVIAGATHDYLCGMVMVRSGGIQMPEMVRRYSNRGVQAVFLVFSSLVLLLFAVVFIYTPGDILARQVFRLSGNAATVSACLIYAAIFVYYILATCYPIDKIIGRIYPFFGLILLVSAVGLFIALFLPGGLGETAELWEDWNVHAFAYGNYFRENRFLPVFFVTVSCGILSGFHSLQIAIVSRTIEREREVKAVTFSTMTAEGFIAMCWGAGAMVVYNRGLASVDPNLAMETAAVICRSLLGPVTGVLALLAVIVLPITSGDTALRSLRMSLAETARLSQKPLRNRIMLAVPIFAAAAAVLAWAKLAPNGFNLLWRYYSWANQVLALFAFLAIVVWMFETKRQRYVWVPIVPACFYAFVTVSYITHAGIGFGQPWPVSYVAGIIAAIAYLAALLWYGKRRGKQSLELRADS